LVPVIVNAVLNEHQLVLDIVAFVALGDFPRSRLGEKQRGKILASWVSRKMRTIAQFSIRDPEAEGSIGTVVPEEAMGRRGSGQSGRAGLGSLVRGGGTTGSSLRHAESVTQMPITEDQPLHLQTGGSDFGHMRQDSSTTYGAATDEREARSDDTPTNETPRPLQLNNTLEYSPVEHMHYDSQEQLSNHQHGQAEYGMRATSGQRTAYGAFDPYKQGQELAEEPPYSNYSSVEQPFRGGAGGGGSGLRVANPVGELTEDDWGQEALRQMNLGDR